MCERVRQWSIKSCENGKNSDKIQQKTREKGWKIVEKTFAKSWKVGKQVGKEIAKKSVKLEK